MPARFLSQPRTSARVHPGDQPVYRLRLLTTGRSRGRLCRMPTRRFCAIIAALGAIALAPAAHSAAAQTYYVDAAVGSDSNDGKTTSTAWHTLCHVNYDVTLNPGDVVLFKGGYR